MLIIQRHVYALCILCIDLCLCFTRICHASMYTLCIDGMYKNVLRGKFISKRITHRRIYLQCWWPNLEVWYRETSYLSILLVWRCCGTWVSVANRGWVAVEQVVPGVVEKELCWPRQARGWQVSWGLPRSSNRAHRPSLWIHFDRNTPVSPGTGPEPEIDILLLSCRSEQWPFTVDLWQRW